MRLPQPFYRLPLRVDAARLLEELAELPDSAWVRHPDAIEGNTSVRLVSVGGGENDEVAGAMEATPQLERLPYVRQIMAGFGVVWGRSRLMRLAPGGSVPEHADINYHWFNRVRVHIPVLTRPEVRFHCGDETVHMAAGEVWIFDNWRLHRVENGSPDERIHLVADTSGSAAFWQLVAQAGVEAAPKIVAYDASRQWRPRTERYNSPKVMTPAEVDLLLLDLRQELPASVASPAEAQKLARLHRLLESFRQDWRQLWALYGDDDAGRDEYGRLRDSMRSVIAPVADSFRARTNQIPIHRILEGRVLRHLLAGDHGVQPASQSRVRHAAVSQFDRPLFIVAAPRSGSTLLFETLAHSSRLWTVGGEAHWLVEGIEALRPGSAGVDSNRLTERHCTDSVAQAALSLLRQRLRDSSGRSVPDGAGVRFLEKTPKNALRIPFFNEIFPDAKFIFLWREPRGNIASIIEAWRSGDWITYPELEGWEGPWSMLLPPGWQSLRGRSMEEVAAYQWECTNRVILQDLESLPSDRSAMVRYEDLVDRPADTIKTLCEFSGVEFDSTMQALTERALPLSRYTLTPPHAEKWRSNAAAIERVLPDVKFTWNRLLAKLSAR